MGSIAQAMYKKLSLVEMSDGTSVAISPNGDYLAVCGGYYEQTKFKLLLETQTGEVLFSEESRFNIFVAGT